MTTDPNARRSSPSARTGLRLHEGPFTHEHLGAIAAMHAEAIDTGFLSSFGPKALTLLYSHIAESPDCRLIAALPPEGGLPVAFICGTTDCRRLYNDFLLRRAWKALPLFLPKLLTFARLRGALETLSYPSRRDEEDAGTAEVVNFVVGPAQRGTGVAAELFKRLLGFFASRGISRVRIVTGENQKAAQRFYEKSGAVRRGGFEVHRGIASVLYSYDIHEARV